MSGLLFINLHAIEVNNDYKVVNTLSWVKKSPVIIIS